MKNILCLIVAVAVFVSCNNTDSKTTEATDNTAATTSAAPTADPISDSANYTSIQWIDSLHQDLGKIKEGQTPEISWRFKNTGNKPLIVVSAQGTCGCTIAEKPEQPVAAGEEAVIKAKFSSEGRSGMNEKQVIVTINTAGNTTHYLNFKVQVEKQ